MPIVFRTTPTGVLQGPYSQLIVSPITNFTAASTVAGQIVLTWSGGAGYNVQYSYALSSGTIQSTSGINPTTITLTSTNSITTTVTLTETVLGGSTSAVSNSVTTLVNNWLILTGANTTGTTNNVAYTTNGINYTLYTAGGSLDAVGTCGITGFDGKFIMSSSGLYSTNGGTTWQTSVPTGQQNNGACYFNGKFFQGGYNATGIYNSTNPSVSWSLQSVPNLNPVGGMFACTLNGTPIAFAFQGNITSGKYIIYYSTDGTTWTGTSMYGTNFTGGGWNYIGYNNQFGSSGSMVICTGGIAAAYSTNGSTWTNCTFSPALITGNYIRGVAYGNGLWMLINGVASTIYTSTDGIAFNTTITSPLTNAKTVSFVNGTWVIGGGVNSNVNNAYYSTNNGTSWTALSLSVGDITGSSNAKY